MKVFDVQEMRHMDELAITQYHIPSILLMEHAAMAVKSYMDDQQMQEKHILILCGPGNNGGDGFALAIQLHQAGYSHVEIFCCVDVDKMSHDERVFADIAKAMPITWHMSTDMLMIKPLIQQQDLLIDALFGTGLTRNIEGFYDALILEMNLSHHVIISIDIASGIHGDTGQLMNCAVQAHTTISFEAYKLGQLLYPGSLYNGHILVKSIGIPLGIMDTLPYAMNVIDDSMVREILPKRFSHSHKGSYGKCLLIGGSMQMHGALTLTAKAILHSGIGTLTLFIPDCIAAILAMKLEESMLLAGPSEQGFFHMYAADVLQRHIQDFDMLVIGNGIGRNTVSEDMVKRVLQSSLPCILDGDALYELGKHKALLKRDAPTILTPHVKEMSYLTGIDLNEIIKNPIQAAKDFASKYPNLILILKDQHTLITDGTEVFMNIAGNHALAKGGSGDVLCGMIAGLFGQSKQALHAAVCGVHAHAYAADMAVETCDANAVIANNIIELLGKVYQNLRQ